MEFNLADLFEAAVDAYPEREYLVANGERRTYAEMEARANQLAHFLADRGIGPGDHVGIYSYNSVEWVETAWAVFKLRAVWININYRYVKDELRYLLTNADLKAIVHQREFSPLVATLLPELPELRHVVVVEDGTSVEPTPGAIAYEDALAGQSEVRDFGPRSGEDLYILYTGGTTGMPKGVVWHHQDVFYALGGGTDPTTNTQIPDPTQMVAKGAGGPMVHLPIAPLMHGATQWCVMGQSFVGSKIVLMAKFDPHEVWRLVDEERVNSVMITGDAMGKPLVESLDDPGFDHQLTSLLAVVSSAALFSAPVKDDFFAHLPNIVITDAIGSSEGGNNGMTMVTAGNTAMKSGPTVHLLGADGRLRREPRPGRTGIRASSARSPARATSPRATTTTRRRRPRSSSKCDGTRYVMPGDYATVEADGSITLLGRGSIVINSGGEKIFPEEVESAVRSHPDVMDAIVCGAPDERWGQTVAAIIQPRVGHEAPSLESIQEHCREAIAGYKVPRRLHVVETVERSPSGKPDYQWAAAIVNAGAEAKSVP